MRVELGVTRDVPQRVGELRTGPTADSRGARELGVVDVNDAGVWRTEFVHVCEGVGVNLLRQCKSVAARLGQADEFLQPCCAGGLEVHTRAGSGEGAADDRVERKLVAAA